MKKSALVFELCYFEDTCYILPVKIVNYPFWISGTFLTKSKNQTLMKKVSDIINNASEGRPDESCDDSYTSSDNQSSTNIEGDNAEIETNKETKKRNSTECCFQVTWPQVTSS